MIHRRWAYFLITVITICLGLASRKFGYILPQFIAEYSGDCLWAAMVYFGLRFIFPLHSILKISISALAFSYFIEIIQLYQADWINSIRNTTIGALILGHGFLWSDLICYTVGIFLAVIVDKCFIIRE